MPATTLVGLDIGSTSIRAVEATMSKDRPVVNNFGQAVLPDGAVVGGVVKDDRAVTSALRTLWSTHNFSCRDVVLGVAHRQVVVREIDIANLPPNELRQALPFLVRDVLPLPPDQALLDFQPLEDPGKRDTVHGLLIAAPKEAVIDTVRAVEAANLHVVQVDLACFATLRASAHLANDTEAVVDIGANATTIVIHTDGTPKIVRAIPRGGAEITKTMAARLGVSSEDAEKLKCRVGLRHDDAADSAELAEVTATAAEALRPLITEIRSSLGYFQSSQGAAAQGTPQSRVARLALVGGAALLPGLAEALTQQLGVPAFLADPMQRVRDPRNGSRHDLLGRFRSSAAVSIGLTLGAA